jgi:hypothetical protein
MLLHGSIDQQQSVFSNGRVRPIVLAKCVSRQSGCNGCLSRCTRGGIGLGNRCTSATLYRHFPTRDALIEAVYHTEVEKLAAAQRELSAKSPPVEALRAWMTLFVDYIAAKHIIAWALNSVVGGPSRLYESSPSEIPLRTS